MVLVIPQYSAFSDARLVYPDYMDKVKFLARCASRKNFSSSSDLQRPLLPWLLFFKFSFVILTKIFFKSSLLLNELSTSMIFSSCSRWLFTLFIASCVSCYRVRKLHGLAFCEGFFFTNPLSHSWPGDFFLAYCSYTFPPSTSLWESSWTTKIRDSCCKLVKQRTKNPAWLSFLGWNRKEMLRGNWDC